MGLYGAIFSTNGPSIEFAVIELLDLAAARAASPKTMDDATGTPFTIDRGDGIGARNRPTTQATLRAKLASAPQIEEQYQDQTANDPDTKLYLTVYEEDLREADLIVAGVCKIVVGSRLLRLLESDGIGFPTDVIRHDFTLGGQIAGLRCFMVKPGLTGERLWLLGFEHVQKTAIE